MKYSDILIYITAFLLLLLIIMSKKYFTQYILTLPGTDKEGYISIRNKALLFKYTLFILCLIYFIYLNNK